MQVSKRLNLAPIARNLSVAQRRKAYQDRCAQLEKLLKRGNMSPKLTQRCEEYLRSAQFRIRQLDKTKATERKGKALAKIAPEIVKETKTVAKAAAPVQRQGVLPGFLSQLNNARIEELVAEKVFARIATRVDAVVDSLIGSDDEKVG